MVYYTYQQSKHGLFAVGSYNGGDDEWNPESKHDSVASAMARTNFLNARAIFVNEGGVVAPDPKEPFAPTRFDRLLEAAFSGLMASPGFAELSQSEVAEWAIGYTQALVAQLDKQKL